MELEKGEENELEKKYETLQEEYDKLQNRSQQEKW